MAFEFAAAGRLVFGAGSIAQAGDAARTLGSRALVVTGRSLDRAAALIRSLEHSSLSTQTFQVDGERSTLRAQLPNSPATVFVKASRT